MFRFSRNVNLISWFCHKLVCRLNSVKVMLRLPNLDNRGIHYPIVAGMEERVTELISTRKWDVSAILLIRSLMEETFVRGGEGPPSAGESRAELCGLAALLVINHRLLAEFEDRSPESFEELEEYYGKCFSDLFRAGDRERERTPRHGSSR